jgi:hypothetical protein
MKRNLFGPADLPPSSGDGACGAEPANPLSGGKTITPPPSPELESRAALAGISGDHDNHEATFRAAADASQGIANSQGSAGIAIGGPTVDGFTTTGNAPGTEFGTVTGGEDHLVQRTSDADNSPDSNMQAGGKAV